MDIVSLVSEAWQQRCHRLSSLDIDSSIKEFNDTFWLNFIESKSSIVLSGEPSGWQSIEILSTVQWPIVNSAYYDVQLVPETTRHVHRMRSTSANIRRALAGSEADKIVSTVKTNLLELSINQVSNLCREITKWLVKERDSYLSPFSPMANIIRNWLNGVYGEKPTTLYPSLQPIMDFGKDKRTVIRESANSLLSVLTKHELIGNSPTIGIVGKGAWIDQILSELRSYGANCNQYDQLHPDLLEDVLFILLPENTLTPEIAELITCKAIVELLPGQINPACDDILYKRNIMVIPDVVCTASIEIVENWWLTGNKVPDWPMALYLRLSELYSEVQTRSSEKDICCHDAALLLALERLTERWNT
jgi:hypothetical protein